MRSFAKALLGQDPVLSPDIINNGNRFNVYRNNVMASLIGVMGAKFPVAKRLVGDTYFDALAHAYISHEPPKSPILEYYGQSFSKFIDTFAPDNAPEYLSDIVRLEWARASAPIETLEFSVGKPFLIETKEALEAAVEMRFELAPGASLISSNYPIATIWDHHQGEVVKPISKWIPETVAIWWFDHKLQQEILTVNVGVLFSKLITGLSFMEAVQGDLSEEQAFHLIESFTSFLNQGLLHPQNQ